MVAPVGFHSRLSPSVEAAIGADELGLLQAACVGKQGAVGVGRASFPSPAGTAGGPWGLPAPVGNLPGLRRAARLQVLRQEKSSSRAHLCEVLVKATALALHPHGVAGAGSCVGGVGPHQPGQRVGARTCKRRGKRARALESPGGRSSSGVRKRRPGRPAGSSEEVSALCQSLPALWHWEVPAAASLCCQCFCGLRRVGPVGRARRTWRLVRSQRRAPEGDGGRGRALEDVLVGCLGAVIA